MVAITLGSGLNAPCVAAGTGLCYAKCRQLLTAGNGWQVLLFLFFTAEKQYGISPQTAGRKGGCNGNTGPTHFFDCQAVFENPSS